MKNKEELLGDNEEYCNLCGGIFELEDLHPVISARKHIGNVCTPCDNVNKNKKAELMQKLKSLKGKFRK